MTHGELVQKVKQQKAKHEKDLKGRKMEVNSKKLDKLYEEWSGVHHTENSCRPVHDSAECVDFAEYCLKYAVSILVGKRAT